MDKPTAITADESAAHEAALRPLIAEARRTYPDAKQRFAHGLKPGYRFYVVTRLYDAEGRYEQVFVRVTRALPDSVRGVLSSTPSLVLLHKPGDELEVRDAAVLDWLIQDPEGSEEGNIVGKFLDTYEPGK